MKQCLTLLALILSIAIQLSAMDSDLKLPQKVIILTIPKSGTHLIHSAAAIITEKPVKQIGYEFNNLKSIDFYDESIDIYHLFSDFRSFKDPLLTKAKVIIMIRDPRDTLISLMHYIEKKCILLPNLRAEEFVKLNLQERLQLLIQEYMGIDSSAYLSYFVKEALFWMQLPNVHVCRFEDLVGPKGGGDRNKQLQSIRDLANFMGCSISETRVEYIADHIFGVNEVVGTGTFRSGQIGGWKEYFGPIEKQMYKERLGQELIQMGYELDYNW